MISLDVRTDPDTGLAVAVDTVEVDVVTVGVEVVRFPITGIEIMVPGKPGPPGDSAYQTWLDEGNTGTEQDFLDSLQGEDGEDGEDSTVPGPPGPPGPPGATNSVYTGQWRWTSKTTDANTAGQVGNDNASTDWAATRLNVNRQKDDNTDVAAHLELVKAGDRLRVQQKTDGTRWGDYEVTAPGVDRGTYYEFPVTVLEHSALEPNNSTETIVSHIVEGEAIFVAKAGDVMEGPLVLYGDAAAPLEAVTKQQWEARTPKITSSTVAPSNPAVGDVWIDTN